jgi:hypothetical protein
MKAKKVVRDEHGPRYVTAARRSVFYDIFPAEKAIEMEINSNRYPRLSEVVRLVSTGRQTRQHQQERK